jgi:hypothetical protein
MDGESLFHIKCLYIWFQELFWAKVHGKLKEGGAQHCREDRENMEKDRRRGNHPLWFVNPNNFFPCQKVFM